ncbi:MAG: response regulator [Spirochaetota bacterium]|jgi:putative two-component system response regulator|nr:response regulator [Spirochaetota bacterium]
MPDTLFVVDDSDTILSVVEQALDKHYRVMTMSSAAKMFSLLEKVKPNLILLDIEMPEMNGLEALKQLKSIRKFADIPVIFLTGRTDAATEAYGFELGAQDFIQKPFSAPVLINRIKSHLDIDKIVRDRTKRLWDVQDNIVSVLVELVENRDKLTGGHIERTGEFVRILMNAMLEHSVYASEIRDMDITMVASSARLHDVGKISISDLILNKPGRLTAEEFGIMKTHCTVGVQIIDQIISKVGDEEFLKNAKVIAQHHHERWDGQGYPNGVSGMDIPLHGRIMAICDVYDALTSVRPYKKALTLQEAVGIITSEAGKQFDPKIVEVFFTVQDQFNMVSLSSRRDCTI